MSNYINKKTMILSGVVVFLLLIVIVLFKQEVIEFDQTTKKIKKVVKVQQPSTPPKRTTPPITTPPKRTTQVTTPPPIITQVTTPPPPITQVTTPPPPITQVTTPPPPITQVTTPPPPITQVTTPPPVTNVNCNDNSFDAFCAKPTEQLKYCKSLRIPTTDKEDLDKVRYCGLVHKTSNEEYSKAQAYFREKEMILSNLPQVDCTNTTGKSFCENPIPYLTDCKVVQNTTKTIQEDFNSVKECAITREISAAKYKEAKDYFASKTPPLILPEFSEINCSPNFCEDPVSQFTYCRPANWITKDEDDFKSTTYCVATGNLSGDNYQKAKNYFKTKGFTLQDIPTIDCSKAIKDDKFCEDPASFFKSCKPLLAPSTIEQDAKKVNECIALGQLKDIVKHSNIKKYFSDLNYDKPIVDIPDINCVNSNICEKPSTFFKSCKPARAPTTDKQDFDKTVNCALSKQTSLKEYEKAKDYFVSKTPPFILPEYPDADCTQDHDDYKCANAAGFYKYCKEFNNYKTTDQQDIKFIYECGKYKRISSEEYKKAQDYFKTRGLNLPEMADIDCNDVSETNKCRKPASYYKYCYNWSSQPEVANVEIKRVAKYIAECGVTKKTTPEEYKKAQDYFMEEFNTKIQDFPDSDIDCFNNTLDYECSKPSTFFKFCNVFKNLNNDFTQDLKDLDTTAMCGINKKTTVEEYKKAQDYFLSKGLELQDIPDVDCRTSDFCEKPLTHLKSCKMIKTPPTTVDKDFDDVITCKLRGNTSSEEYEKTRDYFKSKGKELPNIQNITCSNSDDFCKEPMKEIKYCSKIKSPLSNTVYFNKIKECIANKTIDENTYNQVEQYFKEINYPEKLYGLSDIDCNVNNAFCKQPSSYLKYCTSTIYGYGNDINNDFERIKDCSVTKETSELEYEKIRPYFTERGKILPPYPTNIDCSVDTIDAFCKDPTSQLKYCKTINSNTAAESYANVVKDCVKNNKINKAEYDNVKTYFSQRNPPITLPSYPEVPVNCGDDSDTSFCYNPSAHLRYCKPFKAIKTTLEDDYNRVIRCKTKNIISNTELENVNNYFTELGKEVTIPSTLNCNLNFCDNAYDQLKYCKANRPSTTDKEDIYNVKRCVVNGSIRPDEYNKVKTYFEEKGKTLPDFPYYSINCNQDVCKIPTDYFNFCKPIYSGETEQEELEATINCINSNKITKNEYDKAKQYFATRNPPLVLPDANIRDCEQIIPMEVDPIHNSICQPQFLFNQYQAMISLINTRSISRDKYEIAKKFYSDRGLTLPDYPPVDCNDSLCNNTLEQIKYCNSQWKRTSPLLASWQSPEWVNVIKSCKRQNQMSQTDYDNLRTYFANERGYPFHIRKVIFKGGYMPYE